MRNKRVFMVTVGIVMASAVQVEARSFSKTGARGGVFNAQTTQSGTAINGSGSYVGVRGASANATGGASYNPLTKTATGSGSASAAGPHGNTVGATASGSYNSQSNTYDGQGEVTGPRGGTKGASVTGGNGSATITGTGGKTKTITNPY